MRNGTGGWKKSWGIIVNNAKHSALRLRGSMKIIGDPDLALEELKEERDKSLKRLISGLNDYVTDTHPLVFWASDRPQWLGKRRGEFFRKSTGGNTPSSFP